MPKCSSCGKFYDDDNALELVRNKDNRWMPICRACLDQGVDVDLVSTTHVAVEEAALELADKPGVDVNPIKGDPIANAKKLLEALRTLRHTAEKVGRVRNHERHTVEMTVNFTLARDDVGHEGLVKDLSQGGMRIITEKKLTKGQVLQFDWKTPLPPTLASVLQNQAEVRRVNRNDDNTYSVGLKFIRRQAAKDSNRRRFKRYKCDMRVYYQRKGSEFMRYGSVKDISQGGCQMALDESLEKAEKFQVRIIGGGGIRGDLVGTVQTCRVIPRDSAFEVGCSFVEMRIERLGEIPDKGNTTRIVAPSAAPANPKQ